MTKTFKNRLLGVLISSLVLLTGFFGVSLMNGDNANVAYAETNCTYENGFCTTHTDCYEPCIFPADCYLITNGGNMFWFAREANMSDVPINGEIYADEIDLEGRAWTAIGTASKAYTGTFDGNGKTVKGLNITATSSYQGLFGYVSGGTIKNFTIKGEIVVSGTDTVQVAYVGGAVGHATNSTITQDVTSYVNLTDAKMIADSNHGKQDRIGGVVGSSADSPIKNCDYYGEITISCGDNCGGIVGVIEGHTTITYCTNYGNITFTGDGHHVSGVAGSLGENTIIASCANYGDITSNGNDCLGGVVAYCYRYNKIENCANIGTITYTGSDNGFVGGVLGYINQDSFLGVFNSFNYGAIISNGGTNYAGAIIGNYGKGTGGGNNYYLDTSCEKSSGGSKTVTATAKTAAEFKSGEVAYLLNKGVTNGTQAWYQEISLKYIVNEGNDYPVFSGETVYYTRIGGCCEGSYTYGYRNVDLNDSEISITHGVKNDLRSEEVNGDTYKVCVYCNDCNKLVWEYEVTQKDMVYDGIEHKRDDFWSYTNDGIEREKEFKNYNLVGIIVCNPSTFVRYKEPNGETYKNIRGKDEIIKAVGSYEYELRMYTSGAEIDEDGNWKATTLSDLLGRPSFKYYTEILPAPVTVTFEDYDGATLGETTLDSDNSEYSAPIYTIPSNDYYTYTFKYWHCEQTGGNYTSDNLPTFEELYNANYTEVTFTAVYDKVFKKGFELDGSIDTSTGLSTSGIYTKGESVKIVDVDDDGNVTDDVNVYANYAITTNNGVAALLLIPEYDKTKFAISAVSVNGQSVYGSGATSNKILCGDNGIAWSVTVTDKYTEGKTFKILLEGLPTSKATGELFIQIVYTMSAKNVATGEYSFGFVTDYPEDTSKITHNDRSEAYGVLKESEIAAFSELRISVNDAKIIIVKRENASLELVNNNVVYDAKEVDIFEDCYYKANMSVEQIKNELAYHYSAYGKMLENGDSWDWLQYIKIVAWYDKDGKALAGAPTDVGNYKVGISADENDYFNAIAEIKFDFIITPYTIDVSVEKPDDKTYNADAQTWVDDAFNISYLTGKSAFEGDEGYELTVTDDTKDTTTGNYYEKGDVVRNWAGNYTVTLTFKATANYTFKEQTVSEASAVSETNPVIVISEDGKTKTVTFYVEIKKYAATVSAANKTSEYSDKVDTSELTIGNMEDLVGVVLADMPNNANVLKFVLTTTADSESDCGDYPITITPTGSAANSYQFTYIHEKCDDKDKNGNNGTYTITQKIIDIPTIVDLTYNGKEQIPEVTSAATVNEKVAYSFSGEKQINVGDYELTATLTSKNYKWNSETITTLYTTLGWKIIPVVIEVTIGDYSTPYGADLATISPTIDPENGLQNGETLESIGVTYIIGKGFENEKDDNGKLPVGTYVITANYGGTNYKITFVDGSYEVTKKTLDNKDLTEIIAQIVGATKDYTGSELTWVYDEETKDFTIVGDLNGIAYSDIISITAVAAQSNTDYVNANGKLDNDTWTYWDPETKLYYTVSIKINDTYTKSYMLYADESGNAVTASSVDVEVFINQATNVWTTTSYVIATNINDYEHGADAQFKGEGEVTIVITDSKGNEIDPEDLVYGTEYTITFTVVETNNYTGLKDVKTFTIAGRVQIDRPTVYLDEIGGRICQPGSTGLTITYDGLGHRYIVDPEDTTGIMYKVIRNMGGNSEPWTNVGEEYCIGIALTDNYEWKDGTHTPSVYVLKITKANLTIVADNKSVSFGAQAPEYTVTTTGFVNNENFATYSFTTDVATYLSCAYEAGVTGVGNYDIEFEESCQGDLAAALSNYNVILTGGTLNVTAMHLTFDLSDLQGKLDSGEYDLWTNLVESGYSIEYNAIEHTFYLKEDSYPTELVPTITYNYNGGDFGANLPCNAGTYQIKVEFNIKNGLVKDNYSWDDPTETVTLTIKKVSVTVEVFDQAVTYTGKPITSLNGTDPDGHATLKLTDGRDITDIAYDFIRNSATGVVIVCVKLNDEYEYITVGEHENAILADVTYSEVNYDVTVENGKLIIDKEFLGWTITLKTENRVYNGSEIKEGVDGTDETKAKDYYAWLGDFSDRQYLTYKFYTTDGETYTEISAPANAGTYYVKAFYDDTIKTSTSTDYVEITIDKATIVISGVEDIEKNFLQDYEVNPIATKPVLETEDGFEPIVEIKYISDVTPDGIISNDKPLGSGTYRIEVSIENLNDNYQAEVVEKTLTINRATLKGVEFTYDKDTATWNAITLTTDGENINKYKDKYGEVTVTYKVGEKEITDNTFKATSIGIFTLIASVEGNDNFFGSESPMVEVFSVSFADEVANHNKTDKVYDFGTVAPTQYRFSGQIATQPDCCNKDAEEITIDGYTFAKQWKLDTEIYGFTTPVNKSIILYAVWNINTYTVTWMNDDNKIYSATYEYLDKPKYDEDTYGTPTKDTTDEYKFTFAGWSLKVDGEMVELSAVTANITYYAFYTKDGITYKIIFMVSKDGREYEEYDTIDEAHFGATLTGLCNLASVNWFRGDVWYTDEARTQLITTMPVAKDGITVYGAYVFDIGNGDVNADGQITTDDITIYREWVVGGYEMTVVTSGEEWELVNSGDFKADGKYFLLRVADVNADTSDDIRDITTIRMAIVEGYGYEIATGLRRAKVTGEAVAVITPEIVETEYTFTECSTCRYVDLDGTEVKIDPTSMGGLPSTDPLIDSWFYFTSNESIEGESGEVVLTYEITKDGDSSFLQTNNTASSDRIFYVSAKYYGGKIYLIVNGNANNFSVGDVYSLSFSVRYGRTIFVEKEYTISIVDYSLEYKFYSDTYSVYTEENNEIRVDCARGKYDEVTTNIVTLKINNIPKARRYADFLMVNYELKEGETSIAKDDYTPTANDKFIVTVNTDNLSDGYIELTITVNSDWEDGKTKSDIMNEINGKYYDFSFSVSFNSGFVNEKLCSKEYAIGISNYRL